MHNGAFMGGKRGEARSVASEMFVIRIYEGSFIGRCSFLI